MITGGTVLQIKRAILNAENVIQLNRAVEQSIQAFHAYKLFNPKLSYNENAIIADANLQSGFADTLRLAHQRNKVLVDRERLKTTELQQELDL